MISHIGRKRLYHYLWDSCPGCELEMSKINFQHFEPKMSDLSYKCSQGVPSTVIPNCMGSCRGQILIETETYSFGTKLSLSAAELFGGSG